MPVSKEAVAGLCALSRARLDEELARVDGGEAHHYMAVLLPLLRDIRAVAVDALAILDALGEKCG